MEQDFELLFGSEGRGVFRRDQTPVTIALELMGFGYIPTYQVMVWDDIEAIAAVGMNSTDTTPLTAVAPSTGRQLLCQTKHKTIFGASARLSKTEAYYVEKLEEYARLSEKYMEDAESLLTRRDTVQAGEKLWGAAAAAVKATAARRGKQLRTHAELWSFILDLDKSKPKLLLRRLFGVADHLHSNFYEDELPFEAVEGFAEDVKELIQRLESL